MSPSKSKPIESSRASAPSASTAQASKQSSAAPLGIDPLSRIGNTPLLKFDTLTRAWPHVQLLGKAEWMNPGGSVKDRAAFRIVEHALKQGKLGSGRALLDATSGNTGIAYAMIGAARGIPVTLCVPANVSIERKRVLEAYGATIVWTDPAEGSDGAIRKARELYSSHPTRYYYADQYSNDDNWLAHYDSTAMEIWSQTEGRVTHFVAGLGTSGTFVGVTRRLKELNPAIRAISVQPDSPFHGLEGLKHMETAIVPKIYDPSLSDSELFVATESAYEMVKRMARSEGVLLGISAGAALWAATKVAQEIGQQGSPKAVIVTVLADAADKYLSERFWTET